MSNIQLYKIFARCEQRDGPPRPSAHHVTGRLKKINSFDEEERAGRFPFIVFQMFCYCKCFVALPHGIVGWSAVCLWYFLIILTFWVRNL